jgi:hypothetical protein
MVWLHFGRLFQERIWSPWPEPKGQNLRINIEEKKAQVTKHFDFHHLPV